GYVDDPVVNLTLIALIVIGGLGFFVWSDVYEKKKFQRFGLHTKLTLTMTAALLLGGWVLTMWFEWTNPGTLGGLSTPGKVLASAFQSATLRTAGFSGIDQGALTGPSQGLAVVMMLIGGSPGSTAGGLKTVTVAVLLLTAWTAVCGRSEVIAFERRISSRAIMNAVTMLVVGVVLVFASSVTMSHIEGLPLVPCVYETASAFGTAGLSMGITPQLSAFSRCLLIALMYFGRVGVLTLGVGVLMRKQSPPKITYPEGQVMVG
ncbi:MAG: potassium uptake protein, TrkH family, partial [Clostridiaceae bacterium]|nr:potassium uptake protein, TrkH family [Clostridiaceae bacterium]